MLASFIELVEPGIVAVVTTDVEAGVAFNVDDTVGAVVPKENVALLLAEMLVLVVVLTLDGCTVVGVILLTLSVLAFGS